MCIAIYLYNSGIGKSSSPASEYAKLLPPLINVPARNANVSSITKIVVISDNSKTQGALVRQLEVVTKKQIECLKKQATISAAERTVGESEVLASGKMSHLNGAIGEAQGWENALNNGHIGIQPPGKVTAPGVDFATFDPAKNQVVLWDAKYRGPGGSYPSSVPASKVPGWTQEVRGTVDAMPEGPMKQQILNALNNGRVRTEIFRWPQ
jgi:subtilisin family serine protease